MVTKTKDRCGNGRGWGSPNGESDMVILDGNRCSPNGEGLGEGIGQWVDEGRAEGYGSGSGLCSGHGEKWGEGEGYGHPQGRGGKWGYYDEDEGSAW